MYKVYCVASLGETDTFWRYRTFSESQIESMKDFIKAMQNDGFFVKLFEQIKIGDVIK